MFVQPRSLPVQMHGNGAVGLRKIAAFACSFEERHLAHQLKIHIALNIELGKVSEHR